LIQATNDIIRVYIATIATLLLLVLVCSEWILLLLEQGLGHGHHHLLLDTLGHGLLHLEDHWVDDRLLHHLLLLHPGHRCHVRVVVRLLLL